MPVIAYQESKAGNSSHHLKRMGEFLQCYVKKAIKHLDDGEMVELSNRVVAKLNNMTDKEFAVMEFVVTE